MNTNNRTTVDADANHVVVRTSFTQRRTVIEAGNKFVVDFQCVPENKRDPKVSIFLHVGEKLVNIGSVSYIDGPTPVVAFTTGLADNPHVVLASTLGSALRKVDDSTYELILKT